MRIGIITHNYPPSSERRIDAGGFIYDFAHLLAKHEHVFVLTTSNKPVKKEKDIPLTQFSIPGNTQKLGNWKIVSPATFYRLYFLWKKGKEATEKFTKKNKIDFYLAAWALPSGMFANHAKQKTGTPYAVWCLGSDLNIYAQYPLLRSIIKKSLIQANVVYANSLHLCTKAENIAGVQCNFLPAVTHIDLRSVRISKEQHSIVKFLFVGRLEKIKGPDILLHAAEFLFAKQKKFLVEMIGDGTYLHEMKKMITHLGLEHHVIPLGMKDKKDVLHHMRQADCLVLPSRSESLPLVLIESARCSLPFIATDVGDCARLIDKYKSGILTPREDPLQLSLHMLAVIRRGKNFKDSYTSPLQKMARDFDLRASVKKFLSFARSYD